MIDAYTESVLIFTGMNIILSLSVWVPLAAGQPSVGQAGFMAIGAYTSAYLTVHKVLPVADPTVAFGLALLIGGLAAAFIGLLVGFPALRLKGLYIVIMTLGFGEIVRVFFLNFEPTGAAGGLGGIFPHTTLAWIYALIILLVLFLHRLSRSRVGRAYEATKEDETAAEVIGINLTWVKLQAFTLGAFIAGLGGGLYAHYALFVESGNFGFLRSAEFFIFVVLGGIETFWGAMLGAAILTILPEALRFLKDWRIEFFGTVMILLMIFRPQGLISKRMVVWRS